MSALCIYANPRGKTGSEPNLIDVSLLLPQSTILGVCDALLSTYSNTFISSTIPIDYDSGIFIGGRPKTQPLDIMHVAQLIVEKGIDDNSHACLAQADVRKYYDSLPMMHLLHWLLQKGADKARVFACMRHQLMTTIRVRLPHSTISPLARNRSVGRLTGSRVAGSSAQLPIEEMLVTFAASWISRGFAKRVSVASWIDNLLSFSSSVGGAVGMLEECEEHLRTR